MNEEAMLSMRETVPADLTATIPGRTRFLSRVLQLPSIHLIVQPDVVLCLTSALCHCFPPCSPAPGKLTVEVFGGKTASYRSSQIPPVCLADMLTVTVESVPVSALVDTGAAVSVLHSVFAAPKSKKRYPGPIL